jgi:esterase
MNLYFRKAGKGKPLIILHGLFGSSDNWQYLAKKFSENFTIITPDLRNHGQSAHSDQMDYDIMAKDLELLIRNQDLNDINLIGHSLGGKTAMHFALHFPELVSKLIIVDVSPKYYDMIHDKYLDILLSLNLENYSKREEVDRVLSKRIESLPIRQLLLKNLKREDNGSFAWKINLTGIRQNLSRLGAPVTSGEPFLKPALFIAGVNSDYIKPGDLPDINALFPSARVIYIKNAGHWVHAEVPEQFYSEVIKFLYE